MRILTTPGNQNNYSLRSSFTGLRKALCGNYGSKLSKTASYDDQAAIASYIKAYQDIQRAELMAETFYLQAQGLERVRNDDGTYALVPNRRVRTHRWIGMPTHVPKVQDINPQTGELEYTQDRKGKLVPVRVHHATRSVRHGTEGEVPRTTRYNDNLLDGVSNLITDTHADVSSALGNAAGRWGTFVDKNNASVIPKIYRAAGNAVGHAGARIMGASPAGRMTATNVTGDIFADRAPSSEVAHTLLGETVGGMAPYFSSAAPWLWLNNVYRAIRSGSPANITGVAAQAALPIKVPNTGTAGNQALRRAVGVGKFIGVNAGAFGPQAGGNPEHLSSLQLRADDIQSGVYNDNWLLSQRMKRGNNPGGKPWTPIFFSDDQIDSMRRFRTLSPEQHAILQGLPHPGGGTIGEYLTRMGAPKLRPGVWQAWHRGAGNPVGHIGNPGTTYKPSMIYWGESH